MKVSYRILATMALAGAMVGCKEPRDTSKTGVIISKGSTEIERVLVTTKKITFNVPTFMVDNDGDGLVDQGFILNFEPDTTFYNYSQVGDSIKYRNPYNRIISKTTDRDAGILTVNGRSRSDILNLQQTNVLRQAMGQEKVR